VTHLSGITLPTRCRIGHLLKHIIFKLLQDESCLIQEKRCMLYHLRTWKPCRQC